MTYLELAKIYLDGGIGECTYLHSFDYREGKAAGDLAEALLKAERNLVRFKLAGASAVSEVAYQLGRVLKPKRAGVGPP